VQSSSQIITTNKPTPRFFTGRMSLRSESHWCPSCRPTVRSSDSEWRVQSRSICCPGRELNKLFVICLECFDTDGWWHSLCRTLGIGCWQRWSDWNLASSSCHHRCLHPLISCCSNIQNDLTLWYWLSQLA